MAYKVRARPHKAGARPHKARASYIRAGECSTGQERVIPKPFLQLRLIRPSPTTSVLYLWPRSAQNTVIQKWDNLAQ